ncbi:MAG TPA: LLM class flavin-dependent oxidoreductase [Candidatus Bathyarchaeia archaeon]|nr:LLM class flavin-dependent oxidoreductase [Candidatus Bathyarchaeia archaeon]
MIPVWQKNYFQSEMETYDTTTISMIRYIIFAAKRIVTGVTSAVYRYNLAITAQAFASLDVLHVGRISLGIGCGEAMNEVPLGFDWPDTKVRLARTTEAIEIIHMCKKLHCIYIDDITKLAKFVDNLKQSDYNIEKIITESLNFEVLRATHKHLQENIPSLENRKKDLERECSTLETWISMHKQVLSKYHDLEVMGFGLNHLQFLWTTIREITRENNIDPEEAVTKFLSDVEREYNNKLGFESKIESLRNEVNRLNQEQVILRAGLLSLPLVGPKLVKLTQNGVTEQDIINIAALLEKYSGKDRESFVSELEHYVGLKSGMQELSKQSDEMKIEVESKLELKYRLTGALSNVRPALIDKTDE